MERPERRRRAGGRGEILGGKGWSEGGGGLMASSSGVVVVVIVVALGGARVVAAAAAAVRCLVSIVACVGKCGCGRWTRRKQRLWLGLEDAHAEDGWKAAAQLVGQRIVVVFPAVGGVEEENVPC